MPFDGKLTETQQLAMDLEALDDLLCDATKWTKGAWCRDEAGEALGAGASSAVRWCIAGAIFKVTEGNTERAAAFNRVFEPLVSFVNDRDATTFSDMKKLIADAKTELDKQRL